MHLHLPTPETAHIADLAGHIDAAARIRPSSTPQRPVQRDHCQDQTRDRCSRCEDLETQGTRVLWCRTCCYGIEGFHHNGMSPTSPDWPSWRESWIWRTMELVDDGLDIDQAEEQALRDLPLPNDCRAAVTWSAPSVNP